MVAYSESRQIPNKGRGIQEAAVCGEKKKFQRGIALELFSHRVTQLPMKK